MNHSIRIQYSRLENLKKSSAKTFEIEKINFTKKDLVSIQKFKNRFLGKRLVLIQLSSSTYLLMDKMNNTNPIIYISFRQKFREKQHVVHISRPRNISGNVSASHCLFCLWSRGSSRLPSLSRGTHWQFGNNSTFPFSVVTRASFRMSSAFPRRSGQKLQSLLFHSNETVG